MFRILVASDIHLGYKEKDDVIGNDSFKAFSEVLQIAKEKKVDFVLLGGDLFHENKPSPSCMTRCTEELRKHVLGDGDVKFKLVSDQTENFSHTKSFPYVNFEEPNLNVSMPVFSIHGNHDDPTGKNPVCFLETVSASGLINYFGKYMDMEGFEIKPILLKKGKTHLALYGLGSLPEERLHRLFLHEKIKFLRPAEIPERWFNMAVVHQNRVAHGTKFLPESFLTNLHHLVIWGHEHEAIPEPDYSTEMGFHIYQPGSTVITSLCEGESKEKQAGLLEIFYDTESKENKFQITPVLLNSTRQFIFDVIDLDEMLPGDPTSDEIREYCITKVKSMIRQAKLDHTGHPDQPTLPLIRLRIESKEPLPFLSSQFGLEFKGKVANPKDIILSKIKRKIRTVTISDVDEKKLHEAAEEAGGSKLTNIVDIVTEYFDSKNAKLKILGERLLTTAVKEMVEKESTSAVSDVLDSMIEDMREQLMATNELKGDEIGDVILKVAEFREQARQSEEEEMIKLRKKIDAKGASSSKSASSQRSTPSSKNGNSIESSDEDVVMLSDSEEEVVPKKRPRGGGRGGRGGNRFIFKTEI